MLESMAADTIIEGTFWPEPMRVLRVRADGAAVQIEAVGVIDSRNYDRTLPNEQLVTLMHEVTRGAHTFDAEPRLFRLLFRRPLVQLQRCAPKPLL